MKSHFIFYWAANKSLCRHLPSIYDLNGSYHSERGGKGEGRVGTGEGGGNGAAGPFISSYHLHHVIPGCYQPIS